MKRIRAWLNRNTLGLVLFPWLTASAALLLAKRSIFVHGSFNVYTEIAFSLRSSGILHFWEKASLYRTDFLWFFLLIPLLFGLLTSWTSPRPRLSIVICLAFLADILVTVQTLALVRTGAFQSWKVIWFAVSWAIRNRSVAYFSIPTITIVKLMLPFLALCLSGIIAWVALRKNVRWLNHLTLLTFGLGSVAGLAAYIPRVPGLPWSECVLEIATRATFMSDNLPSNSASAADLVAGYRQAANAPQRTQTPYTGKAAGYNVVLFVMEAMTAEAFDPARDDLADMPNVRRLIDHSFLMKAQYTSVPYTADADFSILTSLYSYEQYGYVDHVVMLPGLMRGLDDEGYSTGFYGWVWKDQRDRDDLLLSSLGFERFGPPLDEKNQSLSADETFYGPVELVEASDHRALSFLRSDIHDWTTSNRRFAVQFSPELGHDPYRELGPHKTDSALLRGHALAVHQDAWLGELLDELQKDGVLNNTIIVLTGDHGMRGSPGNIPVALQSHGMLPDVELRVPMLIAVPGVLNHAVYIDSPTSHVDITPTIRDLLGIDSGRDLEQGLPVYSPAIATRRLFLSTGPFGAFGFYFDGYYYCSNVVGLVYKNPSLDWTGSRPLPFDGAEAQSVRSLLRDHATRQDQLLQSVLSGTYH
jgi:hypothetical protein